MNFNDVLLHEHFNVSLNKYMCFVGNEDANFYFKRKFEKINIHNLFHNA